MSTLSARVISLKSLAGKGKANRSRGPVRDCGVVRISHVRRTCFLPRVSAERQRGRWMCRRWLRARSSIPFGLHPGIPPGARLIAPSALFFAQARLVVPRPRWHWSQRRCDAGHTGGDEGFRSLVLRRLRLAGAGRSSRPMARRAKPPALRPRGPASPTRPAALPSLPPGPPRNGQ